MANIAIVYHSGYGHTKAIAESVHKGAASVAGSQVTLVNVTDAEQHWDTLAKADAILFGAPTYMGSVSAEMKKFMEASSKVWFTQGWKDKLAAGFTVSGSYSGDKLSTLQQFMFFAAQHSMLWASQGIMPGFNTSKGSIEDLNRVGSYSGLMVQANLDQGPEGIAASDFKTAEAFGARIATLAARWARG
ncbi:MAG: flavodoxin family protein [Burkholderiales bacterium]|nr:flavodoxin family protein [Burkholderiales bacterium]